jgi:hypothetical protein
MITGGDLVRRVTKSCRGKSIDRYPQVVTSPILSYEYLTVETSQHRSENSEESPP